MNTSFLAVLSSLAVSAALVACGGSDKTYNISPIFPLSADKCDTYNGEQEGSGMSATCMVSKDDCERAAADWKESMDSSGVDALLFTCD